MNVEVLKKTFQKLVNRHAALRTNYKLIDGKAVREVHGYKDVKFNVTDVSEMGEEDIRASVEREHRKPFDLENGDVFRVILFRKSDVDFILLFNLHHIAADGWSLGILLEEFINGYVSESENKTTVQKSVKKQYLDFVNAQLEFVDSDEGKRQLSYWENELAGEISALSLDTDFPRPAVQTYNGATQHFSLDKKTADKLKMISQREGTTLIVTLLAAYAVFLHRYTGQDEIIIGLPTAGRGKSEFDELAGYLINPVAIRVDFSTDVTFEEIIQQVKSKVRNAMANEDYPFALLVEKLLHKRDASRTPVFQTFFGLQKFVGNEVLQELIVPGNENEIHDWGNLRVSSYNIHQQEGQFDITLEFAEGKNNFSGAIKYNKDLFSSGRISKMKSHLVNLLNDAAVFPEKKIARLNLLSPEEREMITVEWNKTEFEYSGFDCVHNVIDKQAGMSPDSIAVEFENQKLSYRELRDKSNQLANYLKKSGVKNGTLVGLCMERSIDMIVSILGILKTGAAYIPIDNSYPDSRIEHMLEDSKAGFVLTNDNSNMNSSGNSIVINVDKENESISKENEDFKSNVSPDDVAYVIYTSGSTGIPKGVMITHRALSNHMFWMKNVFGFNSSDAVLQKTPFSFDASVWEFYAALMTGGRLVIARPEGHLDMPYMIETIITKNITVLQLVPSLLKMLLDEKGIDNCRNLKYVFCGGEALTKQLADKLFQKLDVRFFNLYGPTEVTIDSVYYKCQKESDESIIPIGKPVYNIQAYILDKYMNPVPVGVTGELFLGGEGVSKGYINNESQTRERFVNDIFRNGSNKLYRTGDLARYRDDGNIEFAGRADNQVKLRGFRIELGEIESNLLKYKGISEAAVIVREDRPGMQRLAAYIAGDLESENPAELLKSFLRKNLPEYMIPQVFIVMNKIPKTPNGKIDRNALPEPEVTALHSAIVQPGNQMEEKLSEIWKQLLNLKEVSIHDNFFELGGDSIVSIQIISRANQAGIKLTPKQIFLHQTIAELAEVAEQSTGSVQQTEAAGEVHQTPIQHWFFEKEIPDVNHYNHSTLLKVPKGIDENAMKDAVRRLIDYHDVLRMRFVKGDSGWMQSYSKEISEIPFSVVDYSNAGISETDNIISMDISELHKKINLEKSNPVLFRLFKTPENEDRLLIIIHHLVIDGVSWRIILEDLYNFYKKVDMGNTGKTDSFKHWSNKLQEYSGSDELRNESRYWLKHKETNFDRLPRDFDSGDDIVESEKKIVKELNETLTQSLIKDVSKAYNTKINDILLTALGIAYNESFGGKKFLIGMEGHGREEVIDGDYSRTAGWFTSMYPVMLEIIDKNNFGECIKNIKETLRQVPNGGIGFGILKYLNKDVSLKKEFSGLSKPEILFNYLGQFSEKPADKSDWKFGKNPLMLIQNGKGSRSHLIEINSMITRGRFRIEFSFSSNVFKDETVNTLTENYINILEKIIEHCLSSESGGYTPSDFSASGLDQQELDNLIANLN